jgi:ABC-type Fe3+ transport system permease subunit|tara:strand:+ start:265 stop:570 length:306 start_codon:yes stop_codon:yes gene_type:complete
MSYYLPFMPTLAILLGPAKLEVYNDGFAHAASFLLILLMAIVTGGVSASAWSMRRRHLEEEDARKLIDQQDPLPKHAFQHLVWTTTMLTICSIYWFYLLIF